MQGLETSTTQAGKTLNKLPGIKHKFKCTKTESNALQCCIQQIWCCSDIPICTGLSTSWAVLCLETKAVELLAGWQQHSIGKHYCCCNLLRFYWRPTPVTSGDHGLTKWPWKWPSEWFCCTINALNERNEYTTAGHLRQSSAKHCTLHRWWFSLPHGHETHSLTSISLPPPTAAACAFWTTVTMK